MTETKGKPRDRMTFSYLRDVEAGGKGITRMVMRPRIPVRITNVHSARRGGSDSGYYAEALADSGADHAFITRKAADWIGINLDALAKVELATPFGRFKVYRTLVRIAVLYEGRRIDLGKVPASIPEKDMVQLGNRPYIVIGRSSVFSQYTMKFDDYRQTLTMERTARE